MSSAYHRRSLRRKQVRSGPLPLEGVLMLPHEHDESPETAATKSKKIELAERDVSCGLIDTDNYTRALAAFRTARCPKGGN